MSTRTMILLAQTVDINVHRTGAMAKPFESGLLILLLLF